MSFEMVTETARMSGKPIYHEKQVKELCALHALNNLFQSSKAFTKSELDSLCSALSPNALINPHRSLLGFGNYDINVIMAALQRKGYEAVWFDKRKDPNCLNLPNISGFILNVPSDYKLGFVMLPLKRRHWITLRSFKGDYYNLDSKIEAPQCIGKESELLTYLKEQLECQEKELFLVVTQQIDEQQLWLKRSSNNPNIIETANIGSSGTNYSDYYDRDAESIQVGDVGNGIVNHTH